jgi:ABC-type antimicrobial peptide transport system permease subunit
VLLVSGFATFALLLAALGVYALVSYDVSQRRREIGIRIALGASARRARTSAVSQTLKLAAIGLLLGLPAALVVGRMLRGLLFGVTRWSRGRLVLPSTEVPNGDEWTHVGVSSRSGLPV